MTQRQRRITGAIAVAIVTWAMVWHLFDGVFNYTDGWPHRAHDLPAMLGLFAGIAGFWFSWTGRLARLFREVV